MNSPDLHRFHKDRGGVFSTGPDMQAPDSYGTAADEARKVREGAGIIDLTDRGRLRLSGKEHLKLLQGMLSNDVIKLEPHKGCYAVSLTVKGKMIADMRLHKADDHVLLDLERGINESFGQHLKKYRLSYKAEIEDITDTTCLFHLCGPGSTHILKDVFNISSPPASEYDSVSIDHNGEEVLIVKLNRTGETGYDIFTSSESGFVIWSAIFDGTEDISPVGLLALDILRIEAGIPVLGADMDDSTIPIEAGLWSALDFEKGCYIGQEVIARIKWRGRVNWHLAGFMPESGSGPIPPGAGIFIEDKNVGRVTSSAHSPALGKTIAIGYVRREHNKEGVSVEIKTDEKSVLKAAVYELPFINNFN